MKDDKNEDVRVIFIKLTAKQYQEMKAIAKEKFSIRSYGGREVTDINNCIKEFCENVQSLTGEIGAPSLLLDGED